jgi:alkylation response protein AidB-like acyl-CoA dehydrogenase
MPRIEQAPPADLIARCRALGDDFAKRAADYDRRGAFPVENFRQLKEAGLLAIMIPAEFGGLGADFLTYTLALEQLARGDASTALAFNMHNIAVGSLAEIDWSALDGRRGDAMLAFRDWIFHQVFEHRALFASATSEPVAGARLSQIRTTYRKTGDGYVLNGVKSFVSMAGHAEYYLVAARAEDHDGAVPAISYLAVERDNPGIRIEDVWDTLGMRGTSSQTLHLENCTVPRERLFMGVEGLGLHRATRQPHWMIGAYNGVYLGIAAAVLDFVCTYMRQRVDPGSGEPLSSQPLVQHRVGELSVQLEAARAVTYDAARLVTEARGSDEANLAIHRAKFLVGELGPWMASHAIRLCGGGTIFRRLPLERLYRDARCGGVMPAKSDDCLTYVGKALLGINVKALDQSYW